MRNIFSFFVLAAFLLGACGQGPSQPTATLTATITETSTPRPSETPTQTPVPPTNTPAPTATTDLTVFLPEGEPLESWNTIPIMPEAVAGEESDSNSYSFSIAASPDEILAYYEVEMGKIGYTLLAVGKGDVNNNMILIFQDAQGVFTMSVIEVVSEGLTVVLMVK